jgi:holin-like protein
MVMKYMTQITIILAVALAGEICAEVIPLPVPASVYGMLLMLTLLFTGIIKIDQVRAAAVLMIEVMAVMFVPSTVAIINFWPLSPKLLLASVLLVFIATMLVMTVTGHTTQLIQRLTRSGDMNVNSDVAVNGDVAANRAETPKETAHDESEAAS